MTDKVLTETERIKTSKTGGNAISLMEPENVSHRSVTKQWHREDVPQLARLMTCTQDFDT